MGKTPAASKLVFLLVPRRALARFSARMKLSSAIGRLRLLGVLEGISFLLLMGVAMPLKYWAGIPEAVSVVGMAHGALFLAYVAAILQAHLEHGWPVKRSALLFVAALLPFGPFVADRKLLRGLPED
jgi:integral membrane protein